MKNVTVATEITLTEDQLALICANVSRGDTPSAKVSTIAQTLVRDAANGGFMLPREAVGRIEAAISSIDPKLIADHVEDSVHKKPGKFILTLEMDPAWEGPMKEASESQGRPIADLMQEMMGHAFVQGWCYALPAEPPPLNITREDWQFLKDLLGVKAVFGSDVMAWIKDLAMPKEEASHAVV